MTADLDALREELARLGFNGWYGRDEYDEHPVQGMWERIANAQLAGPILSDLIAKAGRVDAAEARQSEEVTVEMIAAAWAVVRDRYPSGRVLGPGPGFREAIAAALALRPLCDLEARIVEAETEAEVDREFAETSRLREVSALARATAAEAENEGLRRELSDMKTTAIVAEDLGLWTTKVGGQALYRGYSERKARACAAEANLRRTALAATQPDSTEASRG